MTDATLPTHLSTWSPNAHTLTVGGYQSDESKWPAIQDAMMDAMTRLGNALAPQLAKLNAEFASEGA
jgi:hypothetical protein